MKQNIVYRHLYGQGLKTEGQREKLRKKPENRHELDKREKEGERWVNGFGSE